MKEKMESIELDLSIFDRELLEFLIIKSSEKDISVNKVIENILISYLNSQNETRDI